MSIWPEGTHRGEYDNVLKWIVCDRCDWYETGGPTGCGWAFVDHLAAAHPEETSLDPIDK